MYRRCSSTVVVIAVVVVVYVSSTYVIGCHATFFLLLFSVVHSVSFSFLPQVRVENYRMEEWAILIHLHTLDNIPHDFQTQTDRHIVFLNPSLVLFYPLL